MNIAFLIVLLAVLSGVIAYVGDWLGSYVGKKRLSLFGTRPKRTGKIIGIGAGIAIMFVTLGILSLVFRQSWNVIFRYQSVLEQVTALTAQERSLNSKVGNLETSIKELNTLNETLKRENESFLEQNQQLSEANNVLSQEVQSKTTEVRTLQETVSTLNQQLNEQARQLAINKEQLEARGNLTYRAGELIASTVIAEQLDADIRTALAEFIRDTNNKTAQRGAGEVVLRSEQFLGLVESAMATPGPDIVLLISDNNQFDSVPLTVNIESFEDQKVFSAGQLLVSLPVTLNEQSQIRDIRTEVIHLWQLARNKLLNVSVIETVTPEASLESSSTEGFTNQLLRLKPSSNVSIGLIASTDIYKSGPALLELVILNN
jgi:flagellar biosynthesis GTPase FlhF